MLADDGFEIEVGEDVAVEDDCWFANQLFGELVSARRAHRLRLNRVLDLHAMLRAIADELFDLVRLVGERERDVGDTGVAQRVDLVEQKRAIADGDDGLGRVNRERAEPCAFAACENECLHVI
jgi:hypothetical protein